MYAVDFDDPQYEASKRPERMRPRQNYSPRHDRRKCRNASLASGAHRRQNKRNYL